MKKTACLILAFAAVCALFACGTAEKPAAPAETESAISQNAASASDGERSGDELSGGEQSAPAEKEFLDGKMLLVYGDSITALGSWGRTAAETLNMRFFNGATGGITSGQGIARFPAYVAGRGADYVTLLFGMNDLIMVSAGKPRVTPEQFEENLKKLVQMVRDDGAEPILLTANPLDPDKFWSAQGQSREMYESVGGDPLAWLEVYNGVTRRVADETGAYFVDMFAACDGVPYGRLLRDGIHLSDAGNGIFADALTGWFSERFENDPNAERVSDEASYLDVSSLSERASVYPDGSAGWYTADPALLKIENDGGAVKLSNTNGLWPHAESVPVSPLLVPVEDGYLYYDVSTVGVSTSIILFFGGSTPSAYTEGTYLAINSKLGAKCNEVGDIVPGQDLKGRIKLSDLGIPAQNIKDGSVLITGVKVFVAGAANKPVILRELSVGTE